MESWNFCTEGFGSMDEELEVQRTIKRLEVTVFLCLFKKVIGPIKVHIDNKGIKDVLWRGEMHGPRSWRC